MECGGAIMKVCDFCHVFILVLVTVTRDPFASRSFLLPKFDGGMCLSGNDKLFH